MVPDLVESNKRLHAAALVAAIVSSAKRPHSLAEVVRLDRDVFNAVYPSMDGSPGVLAAAGDGASPDPVAANEGDPDDLLSHSERSAEAREEPRFGRREEPPPSSSADDDVGPKPFLVFDEHRDDQPATAVPPPMASAHQAVRRVRAAALNGLRDTDDRTSRRPSPPRSDGLESRRRAETRRRRRTTAALALVTAFGVTGLGMWTAQGGSRPAKDITIAAAQAPGRTALQNQAIASAQADAAAPEPRGAPTIQVAMALAPTLARPTGLAAPAGPAAATEDTAHLYAAAVALIDAGKAQGVKKLRRIANLDYPPAQFYLAKLYANGGDGLKKDPDQARRWTRRAAEGGELKAMHNLALYMIDGIGGPRDPASAAQWFHRAADQGLIDSQFNLGRLYEQGLGVPRNAAEALKWFLIAAKAGDVDSRSASTRVRTRVSASAAIAAARAADAFQPIGAAAPPAAAEVVTGDLAAAQRALSQLGYYQGPSDGSASPALRMALSAYQGDHGLPTTGVPDGATIARLTSLPR